MKFYYKTIQECEGMKWEIYSENIFDLIFKKINIINCYIIYIDINNLKVDLSKDQTYYYYKLI